MPHEIMIDIETLGARPGSIIASIAAVAFEYIGDTVAIIDGIYESKLDLEDQAINGLTMDTTTVEWWMNQSIAARDSTFGGKKVAAAESLQSVSEFLNRYEKPLIWAHSPSFDIVLLEAAYRAYHLPIPWTYKQLRDTRTLYDLGHVNLSDIPFDDATGAQHVAVSDCFHQIKGIIAARINLKNG